MQLHQLCILIRTLLLINRRSDAVKKVTRLLCLYLGRYGDLHLLLDHFLQVQYCLFLALLLGLVLTVLFRLSVIRGTERFEALPFSSSITLYWVGDDVSFKASCILHINNVRIIGAAGIGLPEVEKRTYDDVSREIELVMEEYLDTSVWELPSTNLHSSKTLQRSFMMNVKLKDI